MGHLFGGGKASVDTAPALTEIATAKTASKSNRSALFATPGGSMGQELTPDEVKKRDTLMGN